MLGEEWLCNSQLGYAELTEEEKSAVAGFAIVWSVFEAKVMASLEASDKDSLNILRIGDYVENKANHLQNIDSFHASLRYFKGRYITNGIPNSRFMKLRIPNRAQSDQVVAVLVGRETRALEILKALLFIVYRYRNNLFHGLKWAGQLRGQRDNFTHAVHVLTEILDAVPRDNN